MSDADGSEAGVVDACRYDVHCLLQWRPLTLGLTQADVRIGSSLEVVSLEDAAVLNSSLQKLVVAQAKQKAREANHAATGSWRDAPPREKPEKSTEKPEKSTERRPIGVVTECVPVDGKILELKRGELRNIEKATGAEIKEKAGLRNFTVIITGPPAIVEEALLQVELAFDSDAAPIIPEARPMPPDEPVPLQHHAAVVAASEQYAAAVVDPHALVEPMAFSREDPPAMAPPGVPAWLRKAAVDSRPATTVDSRAATTAVLENEPELEFAVPSDHPMYGSDGISHEFVEEQDWDIPDHWRHDGQEQQPIANSVVSPLIVHHEAPEQWTDPDPMAGKAAEFFNDRGGFWDDEEDEDDDGAVRNGANGNADRIAPETVLPGRWRHAGRSIVEAEPAQQPQSQLSNDTFQQASDYAAEFALHLPPPTAKAPPSMGYLDSLDDWSQAPAPHAVKAAPPFTVKAAPAAAVVKAAPAVAAVKAAPALVKAAPAVAVKAPPAVVKAAPSMAMSSSSGVAPDRAPALVKAPPWESMGTMPSGAENASERASAPDRWNEAAASSATVRSVKAAPWLAPAAVLPRHPTAATAAASAEDMADYFNDSEALLEADEWMAEITGSTPPLVQQARVFAPAPQPLASSVPEVIVSSDGEAPADGQTAEAGGESGKKKKAKKKKKKGEDTPKADEATPSKALMKAPPAMQNKFASKTGFSGLVESSESEEEAPKVQQKPAKGKGAPAEKKPNVVKAAPVSTSASKAAPAAAKPAPTVAVKPAPAVVAKPPPPAVPAGEDVKQPTRSAAATVVKPAPPGVKPGPSPSVWNARPDDPPRQMWPPSQQSPPSVSPAAATAVGEHAADATVRKPPPPVRQDPPPVVADTSGDVGFSSVGSSRGAPATMTSVKAAPAIGSAKAKPAAKAKFKPMPEPIGMNPLPQSGKKMKAATVMLNGGIPVAQDSSNAASSQKWMERPVEKLVPNARYEEEDDPEMAQYLWDRKAQRPKNDARVAPKQAAAPPPSAFAGPPLSAGPAARVQPPNANRQRALLSQVMEMGFDEPSAKRALASTGWAGVEQALGALFGQ